MLQSENASDYKFRNSMGQGSPLRSGVHDHTVPVETPSDKFMQEYMKNMMTTADARSVAKDDDI
jgi:hypothetical protein